MPTPKDISFITFLINETRGQSVKWEPTAEPEQFVVSFKGKYTAKIDRITDGFDHDYRLCLTDQADRELLSLRDAETEGRLGVLYNLAVRNSLAVDQAIDEIMSPDSEPPITDEDIPF